MCRLLHLTTTPPLLIIGAVELRWNQSAMDPSSKKMLLLASFNTLSFQWKLETFVAKIKSNLYTWSP